MAHVQSVRATLPRRRACALGWACWKACLGGGRRRTAARIEAMTQRGIGLFAAKHHADALSVQEADLATLRRIGASESSILAAQSNLANTYKLGRLKRPCRCNETYTPGVEAQRRGKWRDPRSSQQLRIVLPCCLKRFEEAKVADAQKQHPWRDVFSTRVMNSRSG